MRDNILPFAAMERIMRKAGADRVSEDAKVALQEALEDIGLEIGSAAWDLARHAGRKTVKKEDVRLASR